MPDTNPTWGRVNKLNLATKQLVSSNREGVDGGRGLKMNDVGGMPKPSLFKGGDVPSTTFHLYTMSVGTPI